MTDRRGPPDSVRVCACAGSVCQTGHIAVTVNLPLYVNVIHAYTAKVE